MYDKFKNKLKQKLLKKEAVYEIAATNRLNFLNFCYSSDFLCITRVEADTDKKDELYIVKPDLSILKGSKSLTSDTQKIIPDLMIYEYWIYIKGDTWGFSKLDTPEKVLDMWGGYCED